MKVKRQVRLQGIEGFPLYIFRCKKEEKGFCTAPPHYHNDIEILQPLEGCMQLVVGNEILDAIPGNLYFINPEEIHALYTNSSPAAYRCFILWPEFFALPTENRVRTELIDPIYNSELIFPRTSSDPRLIALMDEVNTLEEQHLSEALILSHFLRLLALMEPHLLPSESGKMDFPLRRAIDYMENHFAEKLSVPQIAQAAGFNSQYFCSYFKKYTCSTPVEYLTALRIRRAKELLRRTDLSVLEVANQSGFENVSFFIQRFKKATGKTPLAYRKSK